MPKNRVSTRDSHYPFYYRTQHDEPVIYVEIYLPKKAELQGGLFRALTSGFKLKEIRSHFRQLNREGDGALKNVKKLTTSGWDVLEEPLSQEEIDHFPRLFFGYTMYEVDGVYLRELAPQPPDEAQTSAKDAAAADDDLVEDLDDNYEDDDYEIVEETTQIIRLIFKYPSADLGLKIISHIKAMLRDPYAEIGEYRDNYQAFAHLLKDFPEEQERAVKQWVRYIGWFLYGFLMYQICDEIARVHAQQEEARQRSHTRNVTDRQAGTVKQDEIWLSTLWHVNLNVILWDEPSE